MLAHVAEEYEDKLYDTSNRDVWLQEKFTLGLDFPNLPYYLDGDVKLTQSIAIMRYIARKHNLAGQTEAEKIRIDLAECQLCDFRSGFTSGLCYRPDFEELKPAYVTNLQDKLKLFSNFLGSNQWFAGGNLSYVDFLIYEALDQHKLLAPECLNSFKNLQDFVARVEALPNVSSYLKSDKNIKWPLNGPSAIFGGK